MKQKTKKPSMAGGLLDRSEMIKLLTQATISLLPKDTNLSSAALGRIIGSAVQVLELAALRVGDQLAMQLVDKLADEKLIGAVTQIADAVVLRAFDQFEGEIAKRLADSKVTNALAGKVADQIAEKVAATFSDKNFIGVVAGQFAAAFSAALQGQPQAAKGKREARAKDSKGRLRWHKDSG
jgi:hypothetical protein